MRGRESGLWAWLRDGAPAGIVMERVENAVALGTPDIFLCWRARAAVLELKSVGRRPSGDVWCELKPEQASFLRRWARAGGRAFVLVRVGVAHAAKMYLIHAEDCHELLKPIRIERLAEISRILTVTSRVQDVLEAICGTN